jgi:uncharacterized surface protein with fasciclin (FAS1) repeats
MKRTGILIGICTVFLFSCVEKHPATRFYQEDELTITAYLEEHTDEYSMLIQLLEMANFKSAFNAYGTYTMFIYSNDVLQDYLDRQQIGSLDEMSTEEAKILVRYHSLKAIVTSSSLGLGKLPVRNLEDDELVSAFDSSGLQGIIINREARVLTRDIMLSNGVLHVIDRTLTPITNSIVQEMEEKGNYSIFIEAARETGFYDVLNDKYDTLAGGAVQRKYFTVFAESDEVFHDAGIMDINDLNAAYENGVSDHTNKLDSLNKFVANHIIPEKALFTKDLETGNYQSYYGELINFVVEQDFQINPEGPQDSLSFISFIENQTDFQAKNGVFHTVDQVLNIFYPEPVEVIWQFNDQPVVRDLLRVNGQDGEYFTSLENFPNMYGTISTMFIHYPWDNYGFLLTGSKKYPNQFGDALIFGAPDWDVTVIMPIKIVKGRYRLYVAAKGAPSGRATIQILVNGVPVGEPVNLNGNRIYINQEQLVGEVNLTETKQNEIRMVTVNSGQGQMDYLRFEPN